MANVFPSYFYYELRWKGSDSQAAFGGVPYTNELVFSTDNGKLIRRSKYKENGSVATWEISLGDGNAVNSITVSGIRAGVHSSNTVTLTPNSTMDMDSGESSTIRTYYTEVTPVYSYYVTVYSGSNTSNTISGAKVYIKYDNQGNVVSTTGTSDYVMEAVTDELGEAALRWTGGSVTVFVKYGNQSVSATVEQQNRTYIPIIGSTIISLPSYSYRGIVTDESGNTISGAKVTLANGYSTETDDAGSFKTDTVFEELKDVVGVISKSPYLEYRGTIKSVSSDALSYPTYVLRTDDSLPTYVMDGNKVMTIYDMSRLMYDQWNDVCKEILGRTLNVDNVMNALYTLTKAHCIKDTTGTLYDFTGKPSGYCPTAFVWDESSTEWGDYAGLINSISKELLNYQWRDNSDRLAGCTLPPFDFDYPYKRCVINGMSNFYKMYTHSMSSITASFYFKDYYGGGIYSSKVSLINWGESSGSLTLGYGEGTSTGVSYTVSYPLNNRILANFPEQIPLLWRFTVDESTSLGTGVYPRVLDAKDMLEVGNDKFTVRTYTTRRTGNNVSVQISGVFNMINFQNDFIFKIPIDRNALIWQFKIPSVDGNAGMLFSGEGSTIRLVHTATVYDASPYATSTVEVSSSGIFPSTTLTTSKPYYRQDFINNGIYLEFLTSQNIPTKFNYLKATIGSKTFWFDVIYRELYICANISSILDTDDYITYDIAGGTATVSFGDNHMSLTTTKS